MYRNNIVYLAKVRSTICKLISINAEPMCIIM